MPPGKNRVRREKMPLLTSNVTWNTKYMYRNLDEHSSVVNQLPAMWINKTGKATNK